MDQMASATTGVTLERNQNILLKQILGEVVSWFEYITVHSCSFFPFLRKNNKKNMFSNRTMSEFRQSVK